MTGHGESVCRADGMTVTTEVRTINNRFFKLNLRISEGFGALEPRIENLTREFIRRGTIYMAVRVDRETSASDFRINQVALLSYRQQVAELLQREPASIGIEGLLQLPGVVDESSGGARDYERVWPSVEEALRTAFARLHAMRVEEGRAMADDLLANRNLIAAELERIQRRAPLVVEGYRVRLTDRLKKLLAELDVSVSASDVVREVGIFAERSDISEETVRLRSHLEQFETLLASEDSNGRKLEFLTQEMFREANTIGSKANDAEIARHVIEVKTCVERIREMIQNVE